MFKLIIRPENHFALIQNSKNINSKLVIFIHGFWGGFLKTWGKIPTLLKKSDKSKNADPILQEWDYLFLGYKTGNVETYIDISKILETNINLSINGNEPFKKSYKRFTLVGHSLGTLGIRQLLCDYSVQPKNFFKMLHNIILLGTPINGSTLAYLAFWQKIADSLKPNNPQLRMLNNWTKSTHSFIQWPVTKVVLGNEDKVVGDSYGDIINWVGDGKIQNTGLNHKNMVQASGYNSTFFDILINALK